MDQQEISENTRNIDPAKKHWNFSAKPDTCQTRNFIGMPLHSAA
jgi:hypothetical protein